MENIVEVINEKMEALEKILANFNSEFPYVLINGYGKMNFNKYSLGQVKMVLGEGDIILDEICVVFLSEKIKRVDFFFKKQNPLSFDFKLIVGGGPARNKKISELLGVPITHIKIFQLSSLEVENKIVKVTAYINEEWPIAL